MRPWLANNGLLLLLLTIHRLFFVMLFGPEGSRENAMELSTAFLVGVRFDLMVLGFLNFPLLPFLKLKWALKNMRYYFIVLAFLTAIVTYADYIYYQHNQDRINQLLLFPAQIPQQWLYALASFGPLIFMIGWMKSCEDTHLVIHWKKYVGLIFLTALAARGSLGQHHLDLRHSQISQVSFINLTCINSLYALDQALRSRR